MWNLSTKEAKAALAYAISKHHGQFRKDGITPYITHPIGVADIVYEHGGTSEQVLAALFHDIVEDCDVSLAQLTSDWETEVGDLVGGLTNTSKQDFPGFNHDQRKAADLERMLKLGVDVFLVKFADILYNISDLEGMGGYAVKFVKGKHDHVVAMIQSVVDRELTVTADFFELLLKLSGRFLVLESVYDITLSKGDSFNCVKKGNHYVLQGTTK